MSPNNPNNPVELFYRKDRKTKENKQSKTPDITFGKALLCIIGLIIVLALGFAIIGFDTKVTFLMAFIGIGTGLGMNLAPVDEMIGGLEAGFNITPILFIVPIFVLALALFKVPPVIAMLSSSLLAIIMGAFTQGDHVELIRLIDSAGIGFSIETGVADLDALLKGRRHT